MLLFLSLLFFSFLCLDLDIIPYINLNIVDRLAYVIQNSMMSPTVTNVRIRLFFYSADSDIRTIHYVRQPNYCLRIATE